ATLDRARQVDGDAERGCAWWQQRAQAGLALAEDDDGAVAMVGSRGATHAVSLAGTATAVPGLAPLPNAIGLAASSQNVEAGRRLLDWLTGEAASSMLPLSPWRA